MTAGDPCSRVAGERRPQECGTTVATWRRPECARLLSCGEGSSRANIVAGWPNANSRRREFEGEYRRRNAKPPKEEPRRVESLAEMGRSTTGRSLLLEKCCGRQGHRGERLRMESKSPRVRFELTSGLGCGGYLCSPAPFLELFQGAEPGKLRRRSDGAVVGRSAAESQGRRGTGSEGPQCCARLLGRGFSGNFAVGQGAAGWQRQRGTRCRRASRATLKFPVEPRRWRFSSREFPDAVSERRSSRGIAVGELQG